MKYQINGTTLQSLEMLISPGEMVYCQTHQMAWMSDGVIMDTNTGGGLMKGLMRAFSGGSLFVTHFTAQGPYDGLVAFCPRVPGTIVARQLGQGETLICRRESFLCAESTVQVGIFFRQQLGGGLFGGEGFILQQITGPGWVFLDIAGELVEKNLGPGERLLVHAGHVAVQEPTVQFGISRVPGFRNLLFGGDGIFLATLTGPGKVLLQSMPIMNLAEEIAKYLPGNASNNTGGGMGGSVANDFIGGIFGN